MITIIADANLKILSSSVDSLIEYSTDALILKLPTKFATPSYSWVSPTNTRFPERPMMRAPELDEEDSYAYKGGILPAMTAGVSAQNMSGMSLFSFRWDTKFSPITKVTVERSILPEEAIIPSNVITELQNQINILINKVNALENN